MRSHLQILSMIYEKVRFITHSRLYSLTDESIMSDGFDLAPQQIDSAKNEIIYQTA